MRRIDRLQASEHAPATEGYTLGALAGLYDALTRMMGIGRAFRDWTVELAQVKPGDRVLDVGCGTGSLTIVAKERAGSAGEVHGVDAAPEMIDTARRKAAQVGADVDFQVGLIEGIPFPGDQFDVVLSSLMLHHLPDDLKRKGLAEIHRVLKPGGCLLAVDFGPPTNPLTKILAAPILSREEYVRSNIRGELPAMMEGTGFTGVEPVAVRYGIIWAIRGNKAST